MISSNHFICSTYNLTSKVVCKVSKSSTMTTLRKIQITLISIETWANFVVWLLIKWLISSTDIFKYYVLQTTADKCAKCISKRSTLNSRVMQLRVSPRELLINALITAVWFTIGSIVCTKSIYLAEKQKQ